VTKKGGVKWEGKTAREVNEGVLKPWKLNCNTQHREEGQVQGSWITNLKKLIKKGKERNVGLFKKENHVMNWWLQNRGH